MKRPFAKRLLPAPLRRRAILPETLDLRDRSVPLVVREHHSARRMILRLSPEGGVKLTVPRRTSASAILAFLDRHRDWADERLAARPRPAELGDGSAIPFRGVSATIRHDPAMRGAAVTLSPAGETLIRIGGAPEHLRRRVRDLLIREARRDLEIAVARHAKAAGASPSGIQIRDTRSRWGSCSSSRRLSFSFRIVMAPPHVLDYLAAHEVAHLKEMNHGAGFWRLCRDLCPDMDRGRLWLKENGASLHAVDLG